MLGPLGHGAATNWSTGAAHPVDAVPILIVPIQLDSPRTAGPTLPSSETQARTWASALRQPTHGP